MISGRPKWWQWPTILSLDAPAVVVAWQALVFDIAGRRDRAAPLFVLGASVWLCYVADRWFEGWRVHPQSIRTRRHSFYQRRRWEIAGACAIVFLADVAVALGNLSSREFFAGALLVLPVAAYLLSHQLIHRNSRWRLPKEICTAVLLAGGVAAFPTAQADACLVVVGEPVAVFALLAFANCALISVWEHAVDQSHGQISLARQFPFGSAFGRWAAALAIAVGLGGGMDGGGAFAALNAAGAASGLLLLWIDRAESVLGREAARVLADAALLTPLVAFAWLQI
ncbi:MAG: hypothetical protein ACREFX_03545 [Opitutaceae bacterium]